MAIPVVPIEVLIEQYRGNSIAADKRYKGKQLILSGEVIKVDRDSKGRPMIVLRAASDASDSVHCFLDKKGDDDVIDLRHGWWISLIGTCAGGNLGIVQLEKCRIESKAPNKLEYLEQLKRSIEENRKK